MRPDGRFAAFTSLVTSGGRASAMSAGAGFFRLDPCFEAGARFRSIR